MRNFSKTMLFSLLYTAFYSTSAVVALSSIIGCALISVLCFDHFVYFNSQLISIYSMQFYLIPSYSKR